MATTVTVYGGFLLSLANKEIDLDTDVLKVILLGSGYTPNYDTHRYKSSLTSEVSGTGYTAAGMTVPSQTYVYDSGTDKATLDSASDLVWTSASFSSPQYAVLYDSTPGTDATRPLIQCWDFGAPQTISGNFTLTFNAAGILDLAR
jgi:hypothetical protein